MKKKKEGGVGKRMGEGGGERNKRKRKRGTMVKGRIKRGEEQVRGREGRSRW